MTRTPADVGKIMRSLATHHNHGEGWRYTRDRGDLVHIRYRSDFTGYNHWTKRLRRAADLKMLTGTDSISRGLCLNRARQDGETRRQHAALRLATAVSWVRVSLRKSTNGPDGTINGNLIHWEEDGEYIETVGPTVGEKIADFLEAEPESPYAIAIAAEVERIWTLERSVHQV